MRGVVRVRIREYKGPLTVLAAGTLGFSLFCIVSAAALADPRVPNISSIKPQNIVDSAFSNINTMAALTVEVVSQYIFTPTATPTPSLSPTFIGSNTSTLSSSPIRNAIPPTRTRVPRPTQTATHIPPITPSQTPLPPTDTYTPIPTETPVPTDIPSNTPVPTNADQPTSTPPEIQASSIPATP